MFLFEDFEVFRKTGTIHIEKNRYPVMLDALLCVSTICVAEKTYEPLFLCSFEPQKEKKPLYLCTLEPLHLK